ncbi:coiled-coil domain containing 169 isoform X1 [Betta splendens]|uniref:Coiled-coil domain containing 169 isoform X1 n=1 Tax=Betta splendens TaxID=158456 RepID=A0A6P7PTE6_BETSP|nr:coiled-coil domain containing 169 isoform X1 [Betta splendens]
MSGDGDYSKYDVAGLQAALQQERQTKEMLEESVSDLRSTMCDLQDRLHSVDGEGNEWKTRFETQTELNGQLQRHVSLIQDRLEELRGDPADRLASIRAYDDMALETLRQRVKLLAEEKRDLQGQLLDCHRRVEQERKAFHKTNDERRAFLSEIAMLSSSEAQRRQFSTRPQGATESEQRSPVRHSTHSAFIHTVCWTLSLRVLVRRGKAASRRVEAELFKGKEREDDGGGVNVKGRGGEKREEKKAQRSRSLTLEHYLKHTP